MKKMKTIKMLSVLLILSCMHPLMAQEKGSSEFSLGYGLATSTQFVYDIGDMWGSIFTLGNVTYDREKSSGAIHLGYKYSIGNKFTLGAVFVYEQVNNDVKSGNDLLGKNVNRFYTLALESDFRYISKEKFQMYSGLGLGYTFGNQDFEASAATEQDADYQVHLINFQITGIGVRVGKSFGGFAELGFGYKGIINLGISYQF